MFFKKNLKRILIVLLIPIIGTFINFFMSMINVYKFQRNKKDVLRWYIKFVLFFVLLIIVLYPLIIAVGKLFESIRVLWFSLMIFLAYLFVVGIGIISIFVEGTIIKRKEEQLF